jgi:hypothetical protein
VNWAEFVVTESHRRSLIVDLLRFLGGSGMKVTGVNASWQNTNIAVGTIELRWDGSHGRTAESQRRSALPRHYRSPGGRVQWVTGSVARGLPDRP